jgi:hypothetical protein
MRQNKHETHPKGGPPSHIDYAVGDAPRAVFASDLDGDGDLDLATANYSSNSVSVLLNQPACDCGVWGDVDGNAAVNPVDVVYMVNYVYKNQDARVQPPDCPYEAGDADCSNQVNPVDVVYFVNYVYKNQNAFCDPCQ